MPSLPAHSTLRIAQLSGVFNNTTNSYKFYWFWGLLSLVAQNDGQDIPLRDVLLKMVSLSWHTVAYYQLSLGGQDQLSEVIGRALALGEVNSQSKQEEVEAYLADCWQEPRPTPEVRALLRALKKLRTYVPYRFIRPFFGRLPKGNPEQAIAERAQATFAVAEDAAPYKINAANRNAQQGRTLTIHPYWRTYLQQHHKILEAFCCWHLSAYLRARNPNVPSVGGKIMPPYTLKRDLKTAKRFWRQALDPSHGLPLRCIYSAAPLLPNMPIDHFIPWSFVLHDQLWNLAPIPMPLNSSKSNRLPDRRYWDPFIQLQYQAVQRCAGPPTEPLLETYSSLFKAPISEVLACPLTQFAQTLQQHLAPLYQQALNLGFEENWLPPHRRAE